MNWLYASLFSLLSVDQIGNDRVCGMDEFRVEVVNVAEEAERLKEAAKAAAKSKDKEGEEEEEEVVPGIPSSIQVNLSPRNRCFTKLDEKSRVVWVSA